MSKYEQIIEWIFFNNYREADAVVPFTRDELALASSELGFARIKNLGDIPYLFRFRRNLPEAIQATAPQNSEWIIVGTGIGKYAFRLASPGKIKPSSHYYTVSHIGQVEIDEIYVGVNKRGTHFILPCQAKSPGDQFGIAQVMQDMALCQERYPTAVCKPIALQFTDENNVAILELAVREENSILKLNVVEEKHYQLVPRSEISESELKMLIKNEPE